MIENLIDTQLVQIFSLDNKKMLIDMMERVEKILATMAKSEHDNQYCLMIDEIHLSSMISVLSIDMQESLNQSCCYDIMFTTPNKQMVIITIFSQVASLIFEVPSLTSLAQISFLEKSTLPRTLYGIITEFSLLSISKDETCYRAALQLSLALFANDHFSAICQNQSVVSMVEKALRWHDFMEIDYRLELKDSYPVREFITQ